MSIEKIVECINAKADMLTRASDNIWEYAEMAFREHKSMNEICAILEAEGFKVEKGIGDVETRWQAPHIRNPSKKAAPATAAATICSVSARWLPPSPSRNI